MSRISVLVILMGCAGVVTAAQGAILVDGQISNEDPSILSGVIADATRFEVDPDVDPPYAFFNVDIGLNEPLVSLTTFPQTVDRDDVRWFLTHFAETGTEADFNSDGTVGLADLAHLATSVPSAVQGTPIATPEPGALLTWIGLIAFSIGATIWRRVLR